MKLLSVASECAPFVKTGGLADVVGALPAALAGHGVQTRVMLPLYPALKAVAEAAIPVLHFDDLLGGPARILSVNAAGIDLLLLEAGHLYDRPGSIYLGPDGHDWGDNASRYGALCIAAAQVALGAIADWHPDVVHAHDWQAGLVPAYLRQAGKVTPPCLITVHNIAFQGLFDASTCATLGLSAHLFTPEGAEYFGRLGFLKAGIALADKVTTVSPTYAKELTTPEFGMGLEGLLQARRADVTGILNGIDLDVWNPETDTALAAPYSAKKLTGKALNRAEVQRRFGLDASAAGPLFCVISRLTNQKGLDLLVAALPVLVGQGAQLVLLGSGDKEMEAQFIAAAHRYAGSVGVIIGYDEALSHLLQGGADAILVPSRFEPCGLTQLYGLRYGTVPVVARSGGLADTVIDANPAALAMGCATGIQFSPVTVPALEQAIERTCHLYRDTATWQKLIRNGMKQPVGWDQSSDAYLRLLRDLMAQGTS
ncbi:MAG: starch synthase [Pseudorhodobacter sp.]|jgi:starch synthase